MNYIDSNLKVVGTRPLRPDGVDKVTGRAMYSADTRVAGMLWGKILRSPHAHARIVKIDTSKAEALKGVYAVCSAADFPDIPSEEAFVGEGPMNFRDLAMNVMARGKALYEGHAIAAVAASTPAIAGPMIREELKATEFKAMALKRCFLPTSSTTIDCLAGASKAIITLLEILLNKVKCSGVSAVPEVATTISKPF